MRNELGEGALARWPGLIDAALGQVLFASMNVPKRSPVSRAASPEKQRPPASPTAPPAPVPAKRQAHWIPVKPKVAEMILDAFRDADTCLRDGQPAIVSATTVDGRALSKLVSRRAVELMRMDGDERLVACGELSEELLASPARLHRALSRTAADALAYVHSVAVALRDESAESAESVLQLQTSDERLVGIFTRGSGVVFCGRGRKLFDRALAETVERLNPAAVA